MWEKIKEKKWEEHLQQLEGSARPHLDTTRAQFISSDLDAVKTLRRLLGLKVPQAFLLFLVFINQ